MEPERTCIACRNKGNKSQFLKVVYNKQGEIFIEDDKKLDGRGAYLCKSQDCLNKCLKNKSLNRTFKTAIPQEFYEELIQKFGFK
ncbi:MAG: YlxR family protein [Clostridia bacterium]|nr:YlxR family protein [Clostridia bacterium]